MDCRPGEIDVNVVSSLEQEAASGLVVDLGSLYDCLARLEDRRDPRGLRYRQVHILVFVLLAKLAGEDRLTAIAEWVWHRKEGLAQALGYRTPAEVFFGEREVGKEGSNRRRCTLEQGLVSLAGAPGFSLTDG